MSDIEVRDRLRREIRKQVSPTPGNSHLSLLGFAVGAAVVAFGLFLLVPKFLPQSGTLPLLKDVKTRIEAKAPATARAPQVEEAAAAAARYAGKSPEAMGEIADEVCLRRVEARYPNWTKVPRLSAKPVNDFHLNDMNAVNDLTQCLLTEAPGRFCSSADRNMMSAEIVQYFLTVGHLRQVLEVVQASRATAPEISPDPKVVAAIEARLSEGSLTAANRDQFNASVPVATRERLARIKPRELTCMVKPWWAVWR